jgi:dephospho-CoA kinase
MTTRTDLHIFFRTIERTTTQAFIGLTGGIGSGKSAVAELLREFGCAVLSADDIGRDITHTDMDVKASIRAVFGEVYLPDGSLDRANMAKFVFGDTPEQKANLARLNAIVHPAVWRMVAERARAFFVQGERFVFNETALLFETGADVWYDAIVVVDAPEVLRIKRLADGRGIPSDEAQRRITAQMPAAEKKMRADYVIRNDGSREKLRQETATFLAMLRRDGIQRRSKTSSAIENQLLS